MVSLNLYDTLPFTNNLGLEGPDSPPFPDLKGVTSQLFILVRP